MPQAAQVAVEARDLCCRVGVVAQVHFRDPEGGIELPAQTTRFWPVRVSEISSRFGCLYLDARKRIPLQGEHWGLLPAFCYANIIEVPELVGDRRQEEHAAEQQRNRRHSWHVAPREDHCGQRCAEQIEEVEAVCLLEPVLQN